MDERQASNAGHWYSVIRRCFPAFQVQSISYLSEGWGSTVWEVNGGHVFRFPKRPAIDSGLRKEIRLLPGLAPALSLPIPQFDFVWQGGPEYEGVFVGYPKLPGVPLLPPHGTRDGVSAEEWSAQTVWPPHQLGEFLTRLHRFPLSRAMALGISSGDGASWRAEYRALYETVQRRVLPLLDEPTDDNLSRVWGEFVDDPANFQFQPALIHRDLSSEHILVEQRARCSSDLAGKMARCSSDLFDPRQGPITGILDWEDAAIGDPAFDFTGLLDYGPEFVQRVLAAYRGPRDGGMLGRARFYRAIVPCHEVLFGLECGLPQHIAAGLKELRGRFGRPD